IGIVPCIHRPGPAIKVRIVDNPHVAAAAAALRHARTRLRSGEIGSPPLRANVTSNGNAVGLKAISGETEKHGARIAELTVAFDFQTVHAVLQESDLRKESDIIIRKVQRTGELARFADHRFALVRAEL